ncbi:hypothetical protein Sxan_72560 [Streptomyces xanthophaeus]|uniref:Uncharacterized protein n=1 Tax=Streptomyces xanthophaeus TaxID=67385 RepID=A0A919H3Q6_9ACTN|nr:hypothetical protein Sxan_72560 [Streptomyces xanthophaeus]
MTLKLNTGWNLNRSGRTPSGPRDLGFFRGRFGSAAPWLTYARTSAPTPEQDTAAEGLAGRPLSAACLRAPAGVTQQYVDGPAKSYSPSAPARVRDAAGGPEWAVGPDAGRHAAPVPPATDCLTRHGISTSD